MLSTRQLKWLLALMAAAWLVPWLGKMSAPMIFGTPAIQWTSAILTPLFGSLGLYLALHAIVFRPADRRKFGSICLSFIVMFVFITGLSLGALYLFSLLDRTTQLLYSPSPVPGYVERLQTEKDQNRRELLASRIYTASGVAVTYPTAAGEYLRYQPSLEAEKLWEKYRSNDAKILETVEILQKQRGEVLRVLGFQIGGLLLALLAFAFTVISRRTPAQQNTFNL